MESVLTSIPMFANLSGAARAALAEICRVQHFTKGEPIFREGDRADRIYFVVHGHVKIVKAAADRDVIIELLGPGEPLGAVAVFEKRPFPAGAIVLQETTVVSFPSRDFIRHVEKEGQLLQDMLAGLTKRLMKVNHRIADMTGPSEFRGARLFLNLAERTGVTTRGQTTIPLPLSRQDVADLLGTTLETAIRLMSRWQKEGIVLTEKEGFVIPDLQKLHDLTSG